MICPTHKEILGTSGKSILGYFSCIIDIAAIYNWFVTEPTQPALIFWIGSSHYKLVLTLDHS